MKDPITAREALKTLQDRERVRDAIHHCCGRIIEVHVCQLLWLARMILSQGVFTLTLPMLQIRSSESQSRARNSTYPQITEIHKVLRRSQGRAQPTPCRPLVLSQYECLEDQRGYSHPAGVITSQRNGQVRFEHHNMNATKNTTIPFLPRFKNMLALPPNLQ